MLPQQNVLVIKTNGSKPKLLAQLSSIAFWNENLACVLSLPFQTPATQANKNSEIEIEEDKWGAKPGE